LSRLGLNYTISALVATWPTFAFLPSASDFLEDTAVSGQAVLSNKSGLPWPPSPLIFGFVVLPICRRLYNHYFNQFSHWLLDTQPAPPRPRNTNGLRGFLQRFLDDMERAADVRVAQQGAANPEGNANPNAGGNGNGNANANANAEGGAVVTLDFRRAPRIVGGALLVPLISSAMGSLLQRLSKHFDFLRRFLAVRPAWKGFLPPPPLRKYTYKEIWNRARAYEPEQVGHTLRFVLRAVWGDIRKLDECDPVW
jgi:hypothetical protein